MYFVGRRWDALAYDVSSNLIYYGELSFGRIGYTDGKNYKTLASGLGIVRAIALHPSYG